MVRACVRNEEVEEKAELLPGGLLEQRWNERLNQACEIASTGNEH